jgi:malate dehydrogenase
VTTLDVVRASQFTAESLETPLESPTYKIPVIGGHSGITILPLISQSQPSASKLSQEQISSLTNRIQFGGDEVVKAKDGAGSATLSMAYAGFRFVESLIHAKWLGKKSVVEYGYIFLKNGTDGGESVRKLIGDDVDYFSVPIELGVSPPSLKSLSSPLSISISRLLNCPPPFLSQAESRRSSPSETSPRTNRNFSERQSPNSRATSQR